MFRMIGIISTFHPACLPFFLEICSLELIPCELSYQWSTKTILNNADDDYYLNHAEIQVANLYFGGCITYV